MKEGKKERRKEGKKEEKKEGKQEGGRERRMTGYIICMFSSTFAYSKFDQILGKLSQREGKGSQRMLKMRLSVIHRDSKINQNI